MTKERKNSIGKNVFYLLYSTVFSSGLNAVTLVILANYLNSQSYGMFSVALAYALIMGYCTDAGISVAVLREGSKKEVSLSALFSSFIKIRLVLLGFTFLGGFFLIQLLYQNQPELLKTTYYLMLPMVTGLALQSISITYFQLIEEMQYLGYIRICSAVLLVSSVLAGMVLSLHPYMICLLYGSSYLLAGSVGIRLVRKRTVIHFKQVFHKGLLKNVLSFIISGLLVVLLPQLGPIVLERTLTLTQVGLFAVAYRIPSALYQIPGVLAGAFYPALFKSYISKGTKEHLQLNILQLKMMAITGMAMTVSFYYIPEILIRSLFGEEWTFASKALQIMSFLLVLQSMNVALADGLTTKALHHRRTAIQAFALLCGIGFYIGFSRQYGIEGAACAAVAIDIVSLAGYWLLNPSKKTLAVKALLPYCSFFAIVFLVINYFLSANSVLATALHLLSLTMIIIIDRELMRKLMNFIYKDKKVETETVERGIENGVS